MYVMCYGWYKPSHSSARGAKFHPRLDDESHGNDFYGDGDHKSMDYATGWTYSVSGTGVEVEAGSTNVAPDATTTQNNTINGVTSTWTGLDLSTQQKPNFVQTTPGAAFQFTEHYAGPGLQTHTIIQRTQTVTSVTDTTSIFQQ